MSFSSNNSSEGRVAASRHELDHKGHEDSPGEVQFSDVIRVLRRRSKVIAGSILVFVVIGALYCTLKTRRYSAVCQLAVYPEGADALSLGDLASGISGVGFDEKLGTQIQILKSKSLAWAVISDLRMDRSVAFAGHRSYFMRSVNVGAAPANIGDTPQARRNQLLELFAASLTVDSVPRTQAVEISFRSSDPILAREVVNHLTAAYSRRNFVTRFDNTMKASDWLTAQLVKLKSKVETEQANLSKFQRDTGIFGIDENNNLVLAKLDELSKELTEAEADRIVKEAKYRVAQSGNPELIGTLVPDSVLPVLRQQEADIKNELARASAEYGPRYPKVIQLTSQLQQVQEALHSEVGNIQERFRTDYQASSDTAKQFRAAFEDQKNQANQMSEGLGKYGIMKREAEAGSELYEDLTAKLQEAAVLASLKATSIDVIDSATTPTSPAEPDIPLTLMLSVILGAGMGLALAFLSEVLDTHLHSPDEIEQISGCPLLGVIPHIGKAGVKRQGERQPFKVIPPGADLGAKSGPALNHDSSFVVYLRPNSQTAEAFRTVRTAIMLASAGTPPRTILVTSALPGDGKSTISANLAATFTQTGARVLLIDADLRRGVIAKTSRIGVTFGLSGSLTGGGDWRTAVEASPEIPNLFILQAGIRPPNPAELLGSSEMSALIEQARAEYDHVVVDSPPVLAVTDSLVLGKRVDAVLVVARVGVTPRANIRRAAVALRSLDVPVIGVLVNDVGTGNAYYGYASKSYNGYYSDPE